MFGLISRQCGCFGILTNEVGGMREDSLALSEGISKKVQLRFNNFERYEYRRERNRPGKLQARHIPCDKPTKISQLKTRAPDVPDARLLP